MNIYTSIPSFLGEVSNPTPATERLAEKQAEDFAASIKVALDVANEEPRTVRDTVAKVRREASSMAEHPEAPEPVELSSEDADIASDALTLVKVAQALALIKENRFRTHLLTNAEVDKGKQSDVDTIGALCVLTQYLAEQIPLPQSGNQAAARKALAGEIVGGQISARGDAPLQDYLDAIEKSEIVSALEHARHNKTQAARDLGVTFRSLRYRLDRLSIV